MFKPLASFLPKLGNRQLFQRNYASTLAFIESSKDGSISKSSLSLLAAAEKLSNPITAVITGSQAEKTAKALKFFYSCKNLEKLILFEDSKLDACLPEKLTPLLVNLLKGKEYSHFVVSNSSVGKSILPRVGALLDVQPVCEVTVIKDPNTFVRPIYAGNVISTIECPTEKKLLSIRASAFAPIAEGSMESVSIKKETDIPPCDLDVNCVKTILTRNERPELTSAQNVVTGGRALKDKETFDKLLSPLADVLHAAIGATRASVDNGLCDNSLQVGQTGKVVAPDLYIAVGVSGAVQHLAGMKDSKIIVAINNDPDAPIFNVADYGLQGDLYKIVPELTEKLREEK
ncbi:YPR004C [Saccharomyces arboricola H-6]|uniref:Probable electron transfer flavoprotein subunit alpha n=1 Tax=Saccharomyces arboricola (strain H-6 / AS 2.3317 / CBS 10644) TaxID=1160507 RepID=J8Q0Y8_SACAR|nr:YPR004C [Saccharomyces arboricola H-6]